MPATGLSDVTYFFLAALMRDESASSLAALEAGCSAVLAACDVDVACACARTGSGFECGASEGARAGAGAATGGIPVSWLDVVLRIGAAV